MIQSLVRPGFAAVLALAASACGRSAAPSAEVENGGPNLPPPFVAAYQCGDERIDAAFQDETMQLRVGGEDIAFHAVVAASGAKYEADGDPTTIFWTKGDGAQFTLRGADYPECAVVDPAGESFADVPASEDSPDEILDEPRAPFHAGGFEPGWALDITDDELVLVADYGARRVAAPTPQPDEGEGTTRYAVPGEALTVTIINAPCADEATGMARPNEVTVEWGETTYRGCGGDPASLLVGGPWTAAEIAGAAVIERAPATLEFDDEGRLSGRGSCNSYSAAYTLGPEALSIGPAMATKMACGAEIMAQEQAFFDVLSTIERFHVDDAGALVLTAGDGRTIVARR